jgi:hypothetical protein
LWALAFATTLSGMKQRPCVSKAVDKTQPRGAPCPAIGARDSVSLSLALDAWAPAAEAEHRILRKLLQAVDPQGAAPALE